MANYLLTGDQFRRTAQTVRDHEDETQPGLPPQESRRGLIPFEFRRYELKTAWVEVAAGSVAKKANAFIVTWDEDTHKYIRLTSGETFELTDPLGNVGGTASTNAATSTIVTGTTGVCWKPHDCNKWEIISTPSALTPLILYDDVAPGDTNKNAWPIKADLTADTSATKVLVQNVFGGLYRGFGTNHTGFTPSPTAKVWCTSGPDGKSHIVWGVGLAKKCKCQLTGALTAGTASCTVDTVTPTDGGQNPVSNSTSATLTAYIQRNPSNTGGYAGADNTVCFIEFHEDDGYWWIYDMPCSA